MAPASSRAAARGRRTSMRWAALLLFAGCAGAAGPTHLVAISHGLSGGAKDLSFLRSAILAESAGGDVRVLCCAANEGRTTDGVKAGGLRVAAEILAALDADPSITSLSLVGNSLGGLYVRYAAAEVRFRRAGLRLRTLMTIGTPHLGVRRYTYLPLPPQLHFAARVAMGQTGADLFHLDGGDSDAPVLVRMSTEPEFLDALFAFEERVLIGNVRGDFMVPAQTALIDVRGGADAAPRYGLRSTAYANARVEFDLPAATSALGAALAPDSGAALGARGAALAPDGAGKARGLPGGAGKATSGSYEQRIAHGLRRKMWRRLGISFDRAAVVPLAHNKLAALRRFGWRSKLFSWIEQTEDGDEIMRLAATILLEARPAAAPQTGAASFQSP
ncbi:putative serine esterase-domain-containing protein [Pelagophyceae sp. CCMP2097]|nr:putative serine esterase-domain-containing protein [Pelagophyceae sp. CCMP2097]|mmetsp:Transcript_2259/g.8247  ORF Transcript_2259/g.8247 Transcript_2259/m.8247 type:complete len:389 (+) Transcript_2259:374-1540(+)